MTSPVAVTNSLDPFRRRWLWALASGTLLALSFPGVGLDFLSWFALIPLFFVLEQDSYWRSFWYSLVAGLAFFGTLLHWLYTLKEWTGPQILPIYLLLIIYLSLYWGAFGVLYTFLKRRLGTLQLALAVPALWVLLELARLMGKLGFSWGDLGYALYRRTELIQLAAITGALGLSSVIVWVNYLLFLTIRRRDWRPLIGAILTWALLFQLGSVALQRPPQGRELHLAIVQPNIPQQRKSNPANLEALLAKYEGLLAQIDASKVELVILPESVLPAYLLQQHEYLEPLSEFAQQNGIHLLFGTIDYRQGRFYNTAALVSPQGEILAQYDKVQLVPFSTEYVPWRDQLERLGFGRLLQELAPAELTPGEAFSPLESPWGGIATPICFESTFSHVSRGFVRNGAELLVTITNDAWFDRSSALPQHFSFGAIRAVEGRRYFVQAANTGISGIISPQGEILTRSGVEQEEILYGRVKLLEGQTFYTRFGDWLAWLSLVYLLAVLIVPKMGTRHRRKLRG